LNEPTLLEAQTREAIDVKLEAAGWVVQDYKKMNLMAGSYGVNGIAIREMPTDTGPADYMLFISGKADGAIKPYPPVTKKGDYIVMRAEMDLVICLSACPQDITSICGNRPRSAHLEIL
jgi:hypothetical protein